MPTYTFKNNDTNEVFEKTMKIAERDQYVQNNPNLTQVITGAPSIGDPVRLGIRRPDDNFRDVLKNVKHHHKKDNINTWQYP